MRFVGKYINIILTPVYCNVVYFCCEIKNYKNMKKIILVIIIPLFGVCTYAQDSIKIPVNDTGKLTVAKVYNDAKSALTGLAQALKVGSEHVYGVIVKQQVVSSIVWLCVDIVILLLSIALWILWWKSRDKDEWWGVPFFSTLIFFIIFFFTINTMVSGFVNPEYGAMKDILSFIK